MTAPKKPRRKKPAEPKAEPTAAARIEPEALTARVRALRLLFDGLLLEGEIVRGRPINRCQDAVRWLLGKLADELEL